MDFRKSSSSLRPLVRVVLICITVSLAAQAAPPTDPGTRAALKFARIYGLVQENYARPIHPDHAVFDGAIRNMLNQLDPFSAFFDRTQFQLLQEQSRGEAMGFGSILYVQPGKVLVLQTAQGSPSGRAGLGPGDQILMVNGERVSSLSFRSLIELLRRSRSHPVHLEVLHPGKLVPNDVKLTPAEVKLPTVDNAFDFPSRRIGYIHLSGFDEKTTEEVADAVERLGGSKLQGLVLDLRNNPGGMVAAAVGVAGLFLKPGSLVLTLRGRKVPEKSFHTRRENRHFDVPLVVLVNGETASAAELLSAALEEHDRAVLVGEPTFGKGVVENIFHLSGHTGLALLIAQYFTPSGRCIQRPLPGTALARNDPGLNQQSNFHTDDGRPVAAGGGVVPDVVIPARAVDPWLEFLNRGGRFTDFASQYLSLHTDVGKSFEADSRVLSDFRDFLLGQGIRVPLKYWAHDQSYLKLRIKTEIFSLVFGLRAGDRVKIEDDPQVQKALTVFPKIPQILKPRPGKARQAARPQRPASRLQAPA